MIAKLILLLGVSASIYRAAPIDNHGAAYYGMLHPDWPCEASLSVLQGEPHPKISILWNTFGTETACLERFLRWPKPKLIEVHLVNECAIRNRDAPPYEFGYGYGVSGYEKAVREAKPRFRRKLARYVRPIAALLTGRELLTCLISPGLESNLSQRAMRKLIRLLKLDFPGCKFVSSGRWVKGARYKETHGRIGWLNAPCVWSNDGVDFNRADLAHAARCRAAFIWHGRFNGWPTHGQPNPDRRARTDWPSAATFRWLAQNL